MAKLVGFPMYDFPEIRSATDMFWQGLHGALRERGISDLPLNLTRPSDLPAFWQDPNLLIGQTCGYPLMAGLCGAAQYIATPGYTTRFGEGAYHKSVIIVRADSDIDSLHEAEGRICAMNMSDSNTGMNLLRLEIAKLGGKRPFFSRVFETLAHRNSMMAIVLGEADIAAIDCVSFALLEQNDPDLARQLEVIHETEESPCLPFITSPDTDDVVLAALQESLVSVASDRRYRDACKRLHLSSISILPSGAYNRVKEIENQAISLRYPVLA